jgi:hypothetical protein
MNQIWVCSIRETTLTIENRSTARKHISVSEFSQNTYVSSVGIKCVGKREIKPALFRRFYHDNNNIWVKRNFLLFFI